VDSGCEHLKKAESAVVGFVFVELFSGVVSVLGRMVDALALGADEGRGRLRYASGSCQPSVDPRMSEWGNPARVMSCYLLLNV
jgi:hypothetical protein